jgi:hypothetical protein
MREWSSSPDSLVELRSVCGTGSRRQVGTLTRVRCLHGIGEMEGFDQLGNWAAKNHRIEPGPLHGDVTAKFRRLRNLNSTRGSGIYAYTGKSEIGP